MTKHGTRWNGEVRCIGEMLDRPLKWRKPRTVFVNSMGDLFHEKVPPIFIAQVFGIMAACPQHTFIVLTKRDPRPWFEYVTHLASFPPGDFCQRQAFGVVGDAYPLHKIKRTFKSYPWPPPNVAIGVSVENQEQADKRIPWLLQTPAARRFISVEPMLGGLVLEPYLWGSAGDTAGYFDRDGRRRSGGAGGQTICPRPLNAFHSIICGCESGPKARPMHEDWARSLRDQCVAAGVPYFLKQLKRDGKIVSMPELDGRVWDQLPWGRNV
jgi:protein gp37